MSIRTVEIKETLKYLAERRNDKLGDDVLDILEGMRDLVAEEAMYHTKCYNKLYNLPSTATVEKNVSFFTRGEALAESWGCTVHVSYYKRK